MADVKLTLKILIKETKLGLQCTKQQTDNVSIQLVNIVKHLASKEQDIFLSRWWRPKTKQIHNKTVNVTSALHFSDTQLQMNVNDANALTVSALWGDVSVMTACCAAH